LFAGALVVAALAGAPVAGAGEARHFAGTITDSMCANGVHDQMRMGPTDADCTTACVAAHGATYVLFDGTKAYELSDQGTPERFAGRRVIVTGTLDAKGRTIHVESIDPAK
jgi:hypothetical protein